MCVKSFAAGNERDPNHPVHAPTGGRRHHRESEKTLTKEPETLFPYQRCIIDLTEFAHKVSVEIRLYENNNDMRTAATLDKVNKLSSSGNTDEPVSQAVFDQNVLGVTSMSTYRVDETTGIGKYDNPEVTIYLSREHVEPHIVSHECTHAAMGLYYAEVLIPDWKAKARKHMTAGNELLAYTQSELFRCVMEFLDDAVKTTEEEQ